MIIRKIPRYDILSPFNRFTNLEIVRLQVLNDPIGTHHSGDLPNITKDKNGVAEFT